MALPVRAGVLELHNGDLIAGEFVSANDNNVVWQSDSLGQITIDKSEIYNLQTTQPLKINGVGDPCRVEGMEEEHLIYSCGNDVEPRRVPLLSLAMIIPYDEFRGGEDSTLEGEINVAGTYARGNEIKDDWEMGGRVVYRQVDWRNSGSLEYSTYSLNESEPDVTWGGRYVLDWFFRERWFLNTEARFGRDETRSVARYYNVGSGTGYQFWENEDTALALTGGLVFFTERYQRPSDPGPHFVPREEQVGWRFGTDFRYKLPLGVELLHQNEFVRSFEQGSDWQLTTTTGFNSMLAERIYSEVTLDYEVDNDPQPDTEREDIRLVIGLSYEW